MATFIKTHILQRHLSIAARKLRATKAYTYLVVFEDGLLRHRMRRSVAPSGPRLQTALQFLRDAGMIDGDQLTAYGASELEAS